MADSLPNPSTYTPISFVTSALQSVNVELTWDEGNPRRSQAIQRAFQGDGDAVGDDLRVYLASSSSEDEEETEEAGGGSGVSLARLRLLTRYVHFSSAVRGKEPSHTLPMTRRHQRAPLLQRNRGVGTWFRFPSVHNVTA